MKSFFIEEHPIKHFYVVLEDCGRYAGVPCICLEEALMLANEGKGRRIFKVNAWKHEIRFVDILVREVDSDD